jgi:Flp pilus assembly pilin Flp
MKYAQTFKKMAWNLAKDESGQTTTEYVLLLVFVVIAVKTVGKQLSTQLQGLMDKAFGRAQAEIGDSGP